MTIPADHARVKQGKVAPESMMQTKDEATVQKIHLCPYKQKTGSMAGSKWPPKITWIRAIIISLVKFKE